MSNKKQARAHNNREKKKEQFSRPAQGEGGGSLKYYVVITALLAVIAYLAVGTLNQNSITRATAATAVRPWPDPGPRFGSGE